MRASEFYWECLRRAFTGRLATAEFFTSILALVFTPLGVMGKAPVEVINWAPTIVFGVVFVGLVAYGFFRAPVDLHKEALIEIRRLNLTIEDKERIQRALNQLWQLRKDGVEIRNKRITPLQRDAWLAEARAWREEVAKAAREISKNLEQWLEILDATSRGTVVDPIDSVHRLHLEIMSEVLYRLQLFLERDLRWPKMGLP